MCWVHNLIITIVGKLLFYLPHCFKINGLIIHEIQYYQHSYSELFYCGAPTQRCLFWRHSLCFTYKATYGDSCICEQLKANFILVISNPEPGTNSMEESVSKLNNTGFSKNRCFSLAAVKTLKQSCTTLSGHATITKQGINLATLQMFAESFKNSNRDLLWVIMRLHCSCLIYTHDFNMMTVEQLWCKEILRHFTT